MKARRPPERDFSVHRCASHDGPSPYLLVDAKGAGVAAANAWLESSALRGLAPTTVRTYAFALRHAWRWMTEQGLTLDELTEAHLLDFLDFLRRRQPQRPLAACSVNLTLGVLRRCYAFQTGHNVPGGPGAAETPTSIFRRSRGLVPSQRVVRRRRPLHVNVPRRLIVPLERQDVAHFFESLRTWRDITIASLMLFCGLRSCEVLRLTLDDIHLDRDALRVRGKGGKDRVLPMAPEVRHSLDGYLRRERPSSAHRACFLVLKGPTRGDPLTPAGLRTVFRHHRIRAGTPDANPHRFRHTFAADMVRAGISLPTLMRLMGHAHIGMTLRYVNLSAEDVQQEFLAAIRQRGYGPTHG